MEPVMEPAAGVAATVKEGDWMCPSCNNHNFASRQATQRQACFPARPATGEVCPSRSLRLVPLRPLRSALPRLRPPAC
eukprot:1621394-Pyramimonas_sp.AAC.1